MEGQPLPPTAMDCIFELMFISISCEVLCATCAVCTNALKIHLNNVVYKFILSPLFLFLRYGFPDLLNLNLP